VTYENTTRHVRSLLGVAAPREGAEARDFFIAGSLGRVFVARTPSGNAALLIPLAEPARAAGRRAAGLALAPHAELEFEHQGKQWRQAAALLECTDARLLDVFAVLAADVSNRLPASPHPLRWRAVLELVDEWQKLLAARPRLAPDRELGLWAELWLLSESTDPDRLLEAWRGPDAGAIDFVINRHGAEVKASRHRHIHHISRTQVEHPIGDLDAYLLSAWVEVDPERGVTLPELLARLSDRLSDPPALLRTVARLGYTPDPAEYTSRFIMLEEPWWIPVDRVPRVRNVDAGITQVRYIVELDDEMRVDADVNERLWYHFLGTRPRIVEEKR
jgi:hypothetical protein